MNINVSIFGIPGYAFCMAIVCQIGLKLGLWAWSPSFLVWVSPNAAPEIGTWVQTIYLVGDSRKEKQGG